ncbi:MAG: FAD-dependent oxidoreductase [Pseudomonadota bacterium]
MNTDVAVIGGGVVGSAIAYGLARRNVRVLVIDGRDRDLRAANANFGLIWLQGKGMNMPAYQLHTRESVALWPEFSAELTEATGIDLHYERNGGLQICLGEADFEQRQATLLRLHNQLGGPAADWEMLDRDALAKLLPQVELGSDVSGASFGRSDGHVNPLRLLAALHAGIVRRGGILRGGSDVLSVQADGRGSFAIDCGSEHVLAERVIIAAGHGSKALAKMVGLDIPIRPQRGQILVTERLEPFLPLPISGLRQTREGTVMIGATHDEAGFDTSTTTDAAASLSAKAIRRIPALREVRLVRQWSGLRILTPDRHPIYSESATHPGAFVAVCHSGVTLAPVHATRLADAFAVGRLPSSLDVFHQRRFDVSKAA